MVERSLSMREVPGSIPGFSIAFCAANATRRPGIEAYASKFDTMLILKLFGTHGYNVNALPIAFNHAHPINYI